MAYKGVIFDLDGTILNSTQLNIEAFHHACEVHLGKRVCENELLKMYGIPLIEQMKYFSPENANNMVQTYREFSHKYHDEKLTLFPEVVTLLKKIKQNKITIGLVTSKTRETAERNLDFFDIKKYFDHLIYFEDVSKHKPNPEPYNIMLNLMQLKPEQVISIGDSPFDILGSQRAGMKTALVNWTTFKREEFENCPPDYIVEDFETFFNLVTS